MRTRQMTIALAALLTSGCVGLGSLEGNVDGVIYHLPKSLLTMTVRQYVDTVNDRVWYTLGGPGGTPEGSQPVLPRDIHSETIADPDHRYVISYRPSALSDDRLCISRKPNGLLQDVQFAADDRTPEVVFNIARFIGGFIGSPGDLPTKVAYNQDMSAPTLEVREFTSKVDPFDDNDIAAFKRALQRAFGSNVNVDFSRMRRMLERSAQTWPAGCSIKDGCRPAAWAKRCDREHICYRTKLNLPIDLVLDGKAIDVKYAEVINTWDIGTISVTRAALVQKITKLKFQDGALIAAIIRKPSEVEEASLMPLNVMNAILSVPSGLWQSALSDQEFKQNALKQLAANQTAIEGFKTKHDAIFLSGADDIEIGGSEKYQLNCMLESKGTASAYGQ